MITYTIHLNHYKKSFDSVLETLKGLKHPTSNDTAKMERIRNSLKFKSGYPYPGKVYTFDYNAIGKQTLPYYDRYPLVLVLSINRYNRTFFGLNFHYLSVKLRKQFVKILIEKKYNQGSDKVYTTNLKAALMGIAKPMYNKCIKQYRVDKIRGILREISPMLLEEVNTVNDNTFIKRNANYVQSIPLSRYIR